MLVYNYVLINQVRGAELARSSHDSVRDLHLACHVNEARKAFDPQLRPETCGEDNTRSKPSRHAPIRIPTVFAKNDPRAMR